MPFEHLPADNRAVHVAGGVDPHPLGARVIRRLRLLILDEGADAAVARAADADALADAGPLVGAGVGPRLGIGHVDGVVGRDEDAARPSELPPLGQRRAALIENLDAVVLAI